MRYYDAETNEETFVHSETGDYITISYAPKKGNIDSKKQVDLGHVCVQFHEGKLRIVGFEWLDIKDGEGTYRKHVFDLLCTKKRIKKIPKKPRK
jgi:hypothetical protein